MSLTEMIRTLFPHMYGEIVVCRDTAAKIQLMCNSVDGLPLRFFAPRKYGIISSYYVEAIPVDDLDLEHTEIIDGIRVTDEIRTFLEIVHHDAPDRVLFECLDYFFAHYTISEIFPYASRYGITKATIQSLMPFATEYFRDKRG